MHEHIKPFIPAIEIPLIAPQFETFAGDAFEESGKRREDIELRVYSREGHAIGHQGSRQFLNTHLEGMVWGHNPGGFPELCRRIQVARYEETVVGIFLRNGRISKF